MKEQKKKKNKNIIVKKVLTKKNIIAKKVLTKKLYKLKGNFKLNKFKIFNKIIDNTNILLDTSPIIIKNVLIIQKNYRGFITRKKLYKLKDNFKLDLINVLLDKFIIFNETIDNTNILLNKLDEKINENCKKKIRKLNFMSEISENIVKLAIRKKYSVCPIWDTKSGDLYICSKKIEVKGFSSDGPSSFGPTEDWDWIYFIDCKRYKEKYFIIYEIKLSNKSEIFRNIKISNNETFGHIVDTNQRGKLRGAFEIIFKKQLGTNCNIIFDSYLKDLD